MSKLVWKNLLVALVWRLQCITWSVKERILHVVPKAPACMFFLQVKLRRHLGQNITCFKKIANFSYSFTTIYEFISIQLCPCNVDAEKYVILTNICVINFFQDNFLKFFWPYHNYYSTFSLY